jgi:mono/diheme cytochrome c family protein
VTSVGRHALLGLAVFAAVAACAVRNERSPLDFPDPGPGGKTDDLGRALAGLAQDYQATHLVEDELVADMRRRRDAAWASALKVLEDVPLLGLLEATEATGDVVLADGQENPRVPRFITWYGIDDMRRMFQHLYQGLLPSERAARRPFAETAIHDAEMWNAQVLDRSKRWPLERYFRYVREMGVCPEDMPDDECARLVQERFNGATGGNPRILYSPSTVKHVLRNYTGILECLRVLDTVGLAQTPADADANFSLCFGSELPANSVLVKAQWQRADFGKDIPAYDTDGTALAARLGGTAHWGEEGDRRADPPSDRIFTIRLSDGSVFRLVGMHIMTKELRHWQWITLWWSDQPDRDFGTDRPAALGGVWKNYKMCVADGFKEEDIDPAARFAELPSLADALRASASGAGGPSWCSNPYLEHGRNNARTNCIGCHQHGGSTVLRDVDGNGVLDPLSVEAIINDEANFPDTGRRQIRELFPADYLYSINRVDDFATLIRSEVLFFDNADRDQVRPRIRHILELAGDAEAGHTLFLANCSTCHGETGEGSSWAPNLTTRVPSRDDELLLQTLLQGKGDMPRWGDRLSDQELADVLAFLRSRFGGGAG